MALWEELVVLYAKTDRHGDALHVLVGELRAYSQAEEYCASRGGAEGRRAAATLLLRLYLNPPGGGAPRFQAAVRLISNQPSNFDPLKVLDMLSPDMPLAVALAPLQKVVRERVHLRKEAQLVRSLHRAQYQATAEVQVSVKSQAVHMSQERVCHSCHMRLARGDGSEVPFFAVYPNGTLSCYKCWRSAGSHVCPVTRRDFSANPTG